MDWRIPIRSHARRKPDPGTGPVLPMMPGMPERRTHDYYRHGITSLLAASSIADGTVISELHRQALAPSSSASS